eukprot:9480415-Pyramimonas_sp.AAC.1
MDPILHQPRNRGGGADFHAPPCPSNVAWLRQRDAGFRPVGRSTNRATACQYLIGGAGGENKNLKKVQDFVHQPID